MSQHIEMGQREWNGLILRLTRQIGHLEVDELEACGLLEAVGACTRAYVEKDVLAWRWHVGKVREQLARQGMTIPWTEQYFC